MAQLAKYKIGQSVMFNDQMAIIKSIIYDNTEKAWTYKLSTNQFAEEKDLRPGAQWRPTQPSVPKPTSQWQLAQPSVPRLTSQWEPAYPTSQTTSIVSQAGGQPVPEFKEGDNVLYEGRQYFIKGVRCRQNDERCTYWLGGGISGGIEVDEFRLQLDPKKSSERLPQIGGRVNYYKKYAKYKQAYLNLKYGK
jgi:hypothetical protein